jgi:hypothetical protein
VPQTSRGLLVVGTDMAKVLAVLYKASLRFYTFVLLYSLI